MFLFTLSSLLALSQAQQYGYGESDCWLAGDSGMMLCLAGSTLHDPALEALYQCSSLADTGYGYGRSADTPAPERSFFGSSGQADKMGAQMRQTDNGECPPFSEMPLAVSDPNNPYPEDAIKDCVLATMGFLDPKGSVRHKKIKKALKTILAPSVLDNFSYGNTTTEKWDNCFADGYKVYMMEKAAECGDAYTEDEAKQIQYYGARMDAFICLNQLTNACQMAFQKSMTDAYYAMMGYGTGYGTSYGTGYGTSYGTGYGTSYGTSYGTGYGTGYGSGANEQVMRSLF
jgi:hypothetical protein